MSEIDRIAQSTAYGELNLLDCSNSSFDFQIGSGTATSDRITLSLSSVLASDLGVSTLDIATGGGASTAIDAIDTAIDSVTSVRGHLSARPRTDWTR